MVIIQKMRALDKLTTRWIFKILKKKKKISLVMKNCVKLNKAKDLYLLMTLITQFLHKFKEKLATLELEINQDYRSLTRTQDKIRKSLLHRMNTMSPPSFQQSGSDQVKKPNSIIISFKQSMKALRWTLNRMPILKGHLNNSHLESWKNPLLLRIPHPFLTGNLINKWVLPHQLISFLLSRELKKI